MPATRAGKQGRCPRCKSTITVPAPAKPAPPATQESRPPPVDAQKRRDEALLDLSQARVQRREDANTRAQERKLLESLGIEPIAEHSGEREQPWLIDILLYPTSTGGLTTLAIIVVVSLLQRLLPWPISLLCIFGGLYVGWYLAECVFDSAKGGTRAPQTFAATVGWREMWSRVSYMAATCILFVCPAGFYHMFTQRTDTIFWALAAWALLFFPMGLLAMVLHDSTSALNPFFLLVAIFRTFLPYVGLMGLFAVLAVLVWLVPRGTGAFVLIDRALLAVAIGGYGALIVAHILGRFYWRYRKRLDWDL